jgi:hypothetical protein
MALRLGSLISACCILGGGAAVAAGSGRANAWASYAFVAPAITRPQRLPVGARVPSSPKICETFGVVPPRSSRRVRALDGLVRRPFSAAVGDLLVPARDKSWMSQL